MEAYPHIENLPCFSKKTFLLQDYHLKATLTSGQAFRWRWVEGSWRGVIGKQWVQLTETPEGMEATTYPPVSDWQWLIHYLQLEIPLSEILNTFPKDPPMQASIEACRGLRLLRQDPWECLASFILSSTKQIVQIQQICETLCARYGEVILPNGWKQGPAYSFPSAERLAMCSEVELRDCKMGFRAPSLRASALAVAEGRLSLEDLMHQPLEAARSTLCQLRGVGPKIADCVLLFAYGFPGAFPVDVWVHRAIQQLYFPKRRQKKARIEAFVRSHFGPNAGYAQQYLFHYMRTLNPNPSSSHS